MWSRLRSVTSRDVTLRALDVLASGRRHRRRRHPRHHGPAASLRHRDAPAVAARAQRGAARGAHRSPASCRQERRARQRCRHAGSERSGRPARRAIRDAGLPVIPIPGANAAIAAISAAGLAAERFAFLGFLPTAPKARRALLTAVAGFRSPSSSTRRRIGSPARWPTSPTRSAAAGGSSSRARSRRNSRRSRGCRSPMSPRGSMRMQIGRAANSCFSSMRRPIPARRRGGPPFVGCRPAAARGRGRASAHARGARRRRRNGNRARCALREDSLAEARRRLTRQAPNRRVQDGAAAIERAPLW